MQDLSPEKDRRGKRRKEEKMAEQVEETQCLTKELRHKFEFKIAAHGAQVFTCANCGEIVDVVEDSQP